MRVVLTAPSSPVASARTATVMVWVPALPPMEATIGISTASATMCSMVASNCLMTAEARMAVTRLINSHQKRAGTIWRTLSVMRSSPMPAEAAQVLVGLLLDHLHHVVDGNDADQALVGVHHRRGLEIVALELARHRFLVGGGQHGLRGPRP